MARNSFFSNGQWNAICDRCGFEFKASELRQTWEGLWTDSKCFEPRQPQDFVRGIPDPQATPWSRVRNPPVFVPNDGPTAVPVELPPNGEI